VSKPKLSEIRARPACICPHNPPADRRYLLYLVERLGKVLEALVGGNFFCDHCVATVESDGGITHDEKCPTPKARALLKELKL